jgi:hypothetical protein
VKFLFLAFLPLASAQDWTIVPGERVGTITSATVRADLDRAFPKGAVEDDQIELDEGMLEPATLVYRKDPSQTLAIAWKDGHPKEVFICFGRRRGSCKWETQSGIGIGTRLKDLEHMNGRVFAVSGFGFNYGGNVLAWNGGKLARLDCGAKLILTLDGDRVRGGDYTVELTSEERHSISGDRPIASDVPAMHKLNPGVVGLLMRFTQETCAHP